MAFQEWITDYENHIRPKRARADAGECDYSEYDLPYEEQLEYLHAMVIDLGPSFIDAALSHYCESQEITDAELRSLELAVQGDSAQSSAHVRDVMAGRAKPETWVIRRVLESR